MPRNANGDYNLVAGNPVVTGTVIESSWANTTIGDLAVAITDSLSRSGQGSMQTQFKAINGTAALPAISFATFPQLGVYAATSIDMRATVGGADRMRWTNTGVDMSVGGVWVPVLTGGSAETETQVLIAGQTVVTFVNNVFGSSFYVSGPNADNGEIFDYAYDAGLQELTLPESYPAGTEIVAKTFGEFI